MSSPRNDLMHGAHADDFASSARNLGFHTFMFKSLNCFTSAQKLTREINPNHCIPLLQCHLFQWGIALDSSIIDKDVDAAELFVHVLIHSQHLILFRDI